MMDDENTRLLARQAATTLLFGEPARIVGSPILIQSPDRTPLYYDYIVETKSGSVGYIRMTASAKDIKPQVASAARGMHPALSSRVLSAQRSFSNSSIRPISPSV